MINTQMILDLLFDFKVESSISESQYEEAISRIDLGWFGYALNLLGVAND